ncbi:MAG: hypothetical protein H0W42_12545 [Gemmatimonadaceae bacterium]|nr:hypothetical protein [Gemmatimonadaceae bacterium]
MNTIIGARFNDGHGPEISALIDRAGAETPDLIDGLIADGWDGYDPWGSTMEAWFALEYACQFLGWPNHPEFRSPYTSGDPDNGWLYAEFVNRIDAGDITYADVEAARSALERLQHGLDLAGLSY